MSEIQSLVARVQWLGDSVDRWNAGMLSALVVAAIAALFIVLTTRMVVFRSKQLTTAQGLLSEAKDRQSAADSKEKDEKIASALKQASESNERAGKAQASLASAEQQAAEANAKAEGFRLDIANANERAASANETAEKERLARLQLEARLADRALTPDQQRRIMSAFKGQTVQLVIVGDTPEISIFGSSIADSIGKAEDVRADISRTSGGGGTAVRGILVGVRTNADASVQRAADLFIHILRETVDGGVGPWDFDKLIAPGGFTTFQHIGKPMNPGETVSLKVFIGSKQ